MAPNAKTLEECAAYLKSTFPSSLLGAEESHFFSPDVYLRFSRQYDGDCTKAAAAFQATIDWRKEFQPHRIDPERDCPSVLNTKFLSAGGVDKEGDSVILLTLADSSFRAAPRPERVKLFVWMLEELARRGKEYFLLISDFSLVGKQKDPEGTNTRDESTNIMDTHYPERMRLTFMYNPPWFISSFAPISTAFMSAKLKAKVRTNCKTKDLLKEIAEDQLPEQLGGKYVTSANLVEGLKRL